MQLTDSYRYNQLIQLKIEIEKQIPNRQYIQDGDFSDAFRLKIKSREISREVSPYDEISTGGQYNITTGRCQFRIYCLYVYDINDVSKNS